MVPDKMKSSKIFLILLISILTGEILKPPEIPTPCDLLLIKISRFPPISHGFFCQRQSQPVGGLYQLSYSKPGPDSGQI